MKKSLTESEALRKIAAYCAYQERCEQEVRQKLTSWNIAYQTIENLIEKLQNEDFINEKRYINSFINGKFRLKKWGRIKIRYALRQKGLPDLAIDKGLQEMDTESYVETLEILAQQKANSIQYSKQNPKSKQTLFRFLQQRGFEIEFIQETLKKLF